MSQYIRAGKVGLEEVFSKVRVKKTHVFVIENKPYVVNMTSMRYKVFKDKGVICVKCGLIGSFFALERHKKQKEGKFHFNLYAINQHGSEILMTRDHILPRSKGGADTVENQQCMCRRCNGEKGDKVE